VTRHEHRQLLSFLQVHIWTVLLTARACNQGLVINKVLSGGITKQGNSEIGSLAPDLHSGDSGAIYGFGRLSW